MSGGNVLAGGLAGDCVRGAYTAQMGTRWNRLAKKPQEDLNKQLKQELSTEKKNPDELLKLLTEYINMSEAAEHPASQKALHGVWNEEKGYTLPKMTISAQEYKAIDQKSFNRVAQKYNLPTKWNNKKNVQENLESLRNDLQRETNKGKTPFQSDWAKYGGYGLDFIGEVSKETHLPGISGWAGTAGKMLDVGKFLTTDDRGKEFSGMAGSMGGTTLGAFLISSGILNVGAGVLPYPGPQLIGGASIVFTGYLGEQFGHSLYNSYQRKKYMWIISMIYQMILVKMIKMNLEQGLNNILL